MRKTARRSIRKRKSWSDAWKPPSSHTGLLKDFIFYSYDPHHDSVVTGPVKLRGQSPYGLRTVPEMLEYCGVAWKKVTGSLLGALLDAGEHTPRAYSMYHKLKRWKGKMARFTYEPRPYMGPAFRAAFQDEKLMNAMWSRSVMKQAPAA